MTTGSPLFRPAFFLRILLFCGVLGLLPEAKATHLVGGDLGYEFIGETVPGSGQFRYKLKLRLYINCGPGSSFPSIMDLLGDQTIPLPVGVYSEDPLNPNAAKNLFLTGNVYLVTYTNITPPLPDDCILGEGQCIEESLLEGEVILPASTAGYHIYFQCFARNEAIDNLILPGEVGIGYYSFIPPTSIPNSSPVFTGVPVPFICINDTTEFITSAVDPDGDSLVFSFETPYASQEEQGGIMFPPNPLNWPIVEVDYQPGYSATQPFGAGGYAYIDQETGAVAYQAVLIGNWVVAIEVKEYRNGVLIGRTRSDLQLLSTPCTNNIAPIPENNTIITEYTVAAGDTLCFPLNFTDANGDTLNLTVNGIIFDGGLFSPPAQITGAMMGDSLLQSSFCWAPSCSAGQDDAYPFSVLVSDDACPPAIYQVVINVTVDPLPGNYAISGPAVACAGQDAAMYCFEGQGGTTYQWSVTGGTAITPLDGPCIEVEWPSVGMGTITLVAENEICNWTDELDVFAQEAPVASFSVDLDTTCLGVKAHVFDIQPQGGTQQWYINGSLSSVNNTGETLPLQFGTSSDLMLIASNQYGCVDSAFASFTIGTYQENVQFYIPNVFSPNGDAKNDRFVVASDQDVSECVIMKIFDRWGKLVYETSNGEFGWNGKRGAAEDAAATSYYYIITVGDETFHGYVDLVR